MSKLKELLGEDTDNIIFPNDNDNDNKEHYIDSTLISVISEEEFEFNDNIYNIYLVRTVDTHYLLHERDDEYIAETSNPMQKNISRDTIVINNDTEGDYLYIQNTLALAHEI